MSIRWLGTGAAKSISGKKPLENTAMSGDEEKALIKNTLTRRYRKRMMDPKDWWMDFQNLVCASEAYSETTLIERLWDRTPGVSEQCGIEY